MTNLKSPELSGTRTLKEIVPEFGGEWVRCRQLASEGKSEEARGVLDHLRGLYEELERAVEPGNTAHGLILRNRRIDLLTLTRSVESCDVKLQATKIKRQILAQHRREASVQAA